MRIRRKKHGYINPCNDVLNDNTPSITEDVDNRELYKPVPFYPTNPSDPDTHLCHIILKKDYNGEYQMMTEDGNVFYNNTIIEFKYDKTKENHQKWIPIRIRNDKTAEFRQGIKNFGNAYHVANSNWYSIHNPILIEYLKTGENIPILETEQDVYYNRNSQLSYTESLRHFHNRVVKYAIINGASKPGDTLIDFAVGKAGDLSKWSFSKLSFVYGLDISKDNIENRIDGACARYLDEKKKRSNFPSAIFLQANSSLNIRDGSAFYNEKDRTISKLIYGDIPKDETLGKGVAKQYGRGHTGFNVSSCQFALHYFFENKTSLSNFMKNLNESTKIGGYFIGTCYNGEKIFNDLKNRKSMTIFKQKRKIWEVTKQYTKNAFNNDETSIGYAIDVYQETINKTIREYLVNFKYLIRIMENYGFIPVTDEEARSINLPSGVGNFKLLFDKITEDVKRNPNIKKYIGKTLSMSYEEKQISFYNNYFVFKKIATHDPVVEELEEEQKPSLSSIPPPSSTPSPPPTNLGPQGVDNRPARFQKKDTEASTKTEETKPKETITTKKGKKIKLVKKTKTSDSKTDS